jgi:aerobic-type carbon monoxide dehydrogenase small subunit (CoxS/CutS family)
LTMKKTIQFVINGTRRKLVVEPNELLMNCIRDQLHLTGTKYVCGIGECGACTVLLNGEPVLSCLTLALDADGKEVVTIEGIAKNNQLDAIQQAFVDEGAVQCGYCIPGLVVMTKSMLTENPAPTENDVSDYLRGNLCRCTGYMNIIKAINKAASELRKTA